MIFTPTLCFADSLFCCGLAVAVLLLRPRALSQWSFVVGMLLLGTESVFNALSIQSLAPETAVTWQRLRLMATACVPAVWLVFSLTYSRGNYREFLRSWWPVLALAFVFPLVWALAYSDSWIVQLVQSHTGEERIFGLGRAGIILNIYCLGGMILVLMNLERTFRASMGTMRWRIKYMILGMAVLFGGKIYVATQVLLFSSVNQSLATFSAIGLFVGSSLIALSMFRSRLANVDLYPSQAVLQHSLTAFLAGSYLLTVGVIAKAVSVLGGNVALPFVTLLVLAGLIGVTILMLSDRVRQQTRRFVSRHFRRPLYDYRKVWSAFTEKTTPSIEEDDFCRATARLIAENFEVLSVTVWLADEDKDKLVFAASTALSEAGASSLVSPLSGVGELVRQLQSRPYPLDVDATREAWVETLRQANPVYFPKKGGNRVCVPMISGGELIGVITLADRVNAVSFSVEELDLLKRIGDEAGARLRNIKLSERLLQAKELEAFQAISAFFVHDLKNTASTLSLMLQNMSVHFEDPAFREDAVRGLGKSVNRLNTLISELSVLRQSLEIRAVDADLNQVMGAALAGLGAAQGFRLVQAPGPLPQVRLDPDQMQKVITNLVMNAREAVGPDGLIRLETGLRNGWAILTVSDDGCGMSPEFIRNRLFKPFQTTKKKGLGIGMFHIKMIVDAHRGRVEVESERGKGTTIRVLLPLSAPGS